MKLFGPYQTDPTTPVPYLSVYREGKLGAVKTVNSSNVTVLHNFIYIVDDDLLMHACILDGLVWCQQYYIGANRVAGIIVFKRDLI